MLTVPFPFDCFFGVRQVTHDSTGNTAVVLGNPLFEVTLVYNSAGNMIGIAL